MLLPLCLCWESLRINIWRSCVQSTLLCIFVGKSHTKYMKIMCSILNVVVVSAKAASGYTRAIPCGTHGDPWQPLARGINMGETTCIWTYMPRTLSCGSIFLIESLDSALLHFVEAIIEDLYEVCRRGRSHGSCQIASWIIQVLIKYSIFFYVLKFLNVVNFLFPSIGMIIKKINY